MGSSNHLFTLFHNAEPKPDKRSRKKTTVLLSGSMSSTQAQGSGQTSPVLLLVAHVRGYLEQKALTAYSNFFSSVYSQVGLVLDVLESTCTCTLCNSDT